jgi:hypothetical protein|tara:strand:+ start:77 stop:628 length:552 start_codon:yes stop_codon:yes gene_type:complete
MAKCAVGSWTASFVKWFDFLGAFSFAFFGCIICGILMVNPFMLMSPPIALGITIGFIVVPVCFKALSSMFIQGGMHPTWTLLYWTTLIYISFIVSFAVVFYMKIKPILGTILNPSAINQLQECVKSIIEGKATNMLNSQLDAATANVTAQINNSIANAADAASPINAVNHVASNMNPSTGRIS